MDHVFGRVFPPMCFQFRLGKWNVHACVPCSGKAQMTQSSDIWFITHKPMRYGMWQQCTNPKIIQWKRKHLIYTLSIHHQRYSVTLGQVEVWSAKCIWWMSGLFCKCLSSCAAVNTTRCHIFFDTFPSTSTVTSETDEIFITDMCTTATTRLNWHQCSPSSVWRFVRSF